MAYNAVESVSIKDTIDEIKNLHFLNEICSLLQDLPLHEMSSRDFAVLDRAIQQCNDMDQIKLAFFSNFTIDMLPKYVSVLAAKEKMNVASYVGGFNQYFQEILSENTALKEYSPDFLILIVSMRSLEPDIAYRFSSLNKETRRAAMHRIIAHFEDWYNAAEKRFTSSFILSNFPIPTFLQNGTADQSDPFGEMKFYYELNSRLNDLFATKRTVVILDIAKLYSRAGYDNIYDPKLYYLAKMEWKETFLPILSEEIIKLISALNGKAKKCLVLDLDNTLWGGVVGEEGPLGVKVGTGDPVSEAFYEFQSKIKAIKNRGILLAICSKNNEEDVHEVFKLRKDMPLKIDDFVEYRINWENKTKNIVELAETLNIGLESMVFIDDNPAECSLVRQALPEVITINLPPTPEVYATIIERLPFFEKAILLDADLTKTEQYQMNRQRNNLKKKIRDLNTYLFSLETTVDIRRPRQEDLERIHQLFTKTNQFNVTTIRYSSAEIKSFCETFDKDLFLVSAADKFGDLGIIGLYLLHISDGVAEVDSFIISCRAMGRGIENAIMNHLKKHCFEKLNLETLEAHYTPTKKNKPVENFFEEQGFEIAVIDEQGSKYYRLKKTLSESRDCSWINVTAEDA